MSKQFVSVMPEIIEMRKEWKKKFGNTEVFDYFYMNLRDKIIAEHKRSMEEWAKSEKLTKKAMKDTWLYEESK